MKQPIASKRQLVAYINYTSLRKHFYSAFANANGSTVENHWSRSDFQCCFALPFLIKKCLLNQQNPF